MQFISSIEMNNSLVLVCPGHGRIALVPKTDLEPTTQRVQRGKLMYDAGQYRACLQYLEKTQAAAVEHANLKAACYIRLKDYWTALKTLQGLEDRAEVQYNRALCLYAVMKCEESLSLLDACALQDSDTHKLRACLLLKLGRNPQAELSLTHFSSLNLTLQVRSRPATRLPSAHKRPTSSFLNKSSSEVVLQHRKHISVAIPAQTSAFLRAETPSSGKSSAQERENIQVARKISKSFCLQLDDRKKSKEKKMMWAKKFVFSAVAREKGKNKDPPTPPGLKMKDMDTHRNSFVLDPSVFQEIKQTDAFVTSQQARALFPSSNPYRTFSAEGFKRLSYYTTLKVIEEFKKQERDLDLLYTYLKDTKFISRFYPEMGKSILAKGILDEIQQGEVVFRQNDPGLHLYMIIRGSVEVVKLANEFGRYPLVVASIYDGEVFGDYSIVKAGLLQMVPHNRSADCRAAEHCWLMKVEMEAYLQIINSYQMAHLEDQLKFLCRLPMFAGAQNLELCIMADHLESKDYRLEEVILDKGEIASKLYIIMLGRVLATGKIRTRVYLRDYKKGFQPRIRDKEAAAPMVAGQFFGELSLIDTPNPSATRFAAWSGNVRIVTLSREHTMMIPEPLRSNFMEYLRKSTHYEQRIPSADEDDEQQR